MLGHILSNPIRKTLGGIIRVPSIPVGTVLAYDNFTGVDGTDISSRSPLVGPGWVVTGGNATIQDNALSLDTDYMMATMDVGVADVEVTADWTPAVGASNRQLITVRGITGDNAWGLMVRENNNDWLLREGAGIGGTTIDSGAYTFVQGTTYQVRFRAQGSMLYGYIDGNLIFSQATGGTYDSQTLVGTYRFVGSDLTLLDNFEVRSI